MATVLPSGRYRYSEDLVSLDQCRAAVPVILPRGLGEVATPLVWRAWQACLARHPDRMFADWVVNGIREGFRIGFNYAQHHPKGARRNMASASERPQLIRDYLAKECAEGRIMGPFERSALPQVQVSKFGIIPKSTPGKWRLIVDLSSPEGYSVNDGIDERLCSLSYISIDDASKAVLAEGRGTLLAKVDIHNAYRMLSVHPDDRWLLGMQWEDGLYVDTALPFGLRSAPKIFTGVADAVEWIARQEGVAKILHYLDDFLLVGRPGSTECGKALSTLLGMFERLGIPVASEKLEGPTQVLTFLGIEVDTSALEIRLPQAKLAELRTLVRSWRGRKSCSKRDLQSLTGKLQHACKVVRPGRSFIRRMFELLAGIRKAHHPIRLNNAFKSDLMWWDSFLEAWNGVSLLQSVLHRAPDHHLYTDAAGSFGCGAIWGHRWFQYRWSRAFRDEEISQQELLPIVIACMVWGRQWQGQAILCHCDNMAVVQVVHSGYSTDRQLMRLIRCLFFIRAYWQISVRAVHIPGELNVVADAISRNNTPLLFQKVPDANPEPTPLPAPLLDLLVEHQPDWLSPSWAQLFKSCLQLV